MYRVLRTRITSFKLLKSSRSLRLLSTTSPNPLPNPWLIGGVCAAVLGGGIIYYKSRGSTATHVDSIVHPSVVSAKSSHLPSEPEEPEYDPVTSNLPELPGYVQYLLVGGGTASQTCAEEILKNDPGAKILIITEEEYRPYRRPPLSKYLWNSDDKNLINNLKYAFGPDEYPIFYKSASSYSPPSLITIDPPTPVLSLSTGHRVKEIDSENKYVTLANGWEIFFDKCLLATGGKPGSLKLFSDDVIKPFVSTYRSAKDFLTLVEGVREKDVLLVGGGFLGSELAVSLAQKKSRGQCGRVLQVYPEAGNMGLVFPKDLSRWATEKVKQEGVEVYPGNYVESVYKYRGRIHAVTSEGDELVVDKVVLAVGILPCTELAESGNFEVDTKYGGYKVNQEMQIRSDIWAAGDVACFYDPLLGNRRVEHHDHATVSGKIAGENMSRSGARVSYDHQSMFWCDIGKDIAFEAIGLCDSSLPVVSFWRTNGYAKPEISKTDSYGKGLVFYLKEGIISGIICMNLKNRISAGRDILSERYTDEDFEEVVRKMKLFEDK
ncbi:Programmed cell death 8/apoptosis inducing factor [Oopsacas minuta]|uniref:Programmed cell death 8/apoptosis inducing factor n=1 Tax=Oopsacas minuta TaxID=111878 RepID=A0AAV7JB89_9METZ|nr:Programmed cell death 8/apoptosis inducing factor [Oopsacas minuta]